MKALEHPRYQELLKKLMLANNFQENAEFRKMYFAEADVLLPILKALEK